MYKNFKNLIMKKTLLILLSFFTIISKSQTLMSVGPQITTYSGATRGYHFTAPVSFDMCGLFIPTDASTGTQDIRVVRFTAGAPPAFAATTLLYTTLFTASGVASTTTLSCSIPIAAGDIIGIYGTRSTACINSYGNPNVLTSIMGFTTTLQRSGTQNCIGTLATWPLPIWSEVSGSIGRIYMYYNCCITPTITAIASPTSICNGASVAILGGGATTYTWMPGSINTESIVVTPSVTTSYTLSGSNAGCTSTETVEVTVNPTPTISLVPLPSSICNGESAAILGSGAATYTWMPGSINTESISVTPSLTTTYTLSGTSAAGCVGTETVEVTVNSIPTISAIASNSIICMGGSTTLSGTGGSTYSWTGGITDGVAFSPTVTTTYTVTGTSISGCTNTSIITVTVINIPVISVNSPTICAGETATLSVSGATSYSWNTGETTSNINPSPLTSLNYTVTGYNSICSSSLVASVSVNTLTVYTSTIISCANKPNTINAGISSATSYTWSNSVNTISQVVAPSTTQTYSVSGNIGSCHVLSSVITLSINPLFTDYTGIDEQFVIKDNLLTLINASTGASNYEWDFCDGTSSILTNQLFLAKDTGYCCIKLIAKNISCRDSTFKCFNIVNEASFVAPNVFTPNGDSRNDVFKIKTDGIKTLSCFIFDRWGIKVYEWDGINGGWDGTTKKGEAADGVYYFVLEYTDYKNNARKSKGIFHLFNN